MTFSLWRRLRGLRSKLGALAALPGEFERRMSELQTQVVALRHDMADETQRRAKEHVASTEQTLVLRQQLAAVLARSRPSAGEQLERGLAYRQGLNAIGVLNYENDVVSGERRFLACFGKSHPAAVVLDVGGNEGQYARLVRQLVPQAVIHSFEPSPVSFPKLAQTAREIDASAHQLALGDASTDIEFFDYADEAGSQHASVYREVIEGVHKRPASSTKVPCRTLDEFAKQAGIGRIGLLKIDTEGHEMAVLRGARQLLGAGAIDVVQFEFNEMNVISRVFMKDFFDVLGNYRLYRLLQDEALELAQYDPRMMEIFAYQNIAAIRRDLDPGWIHGNA